MAESVREEQLVIFRLDRELFGLDIGTVQEIINWQPVTRMPQTPEYVEGITNLRGRIIPVIDLRKRFGLPAAVDRETRIVVTEIRGQVVGMVVDGVSEVKRIAADQIVPPVEVTAGHTTDFVRGVARTEGRLIILMDLTHILTGAGNRLLPMTS